MRVLVTGAAGLLGSACVAALLARGDEVIALVRDRRPASRLIREGLLARVIEVRGDLRAAPRLLDQYCPEGVLHLAAQSQVQAALRDPAGTFEANVRGTWLLLEACRRAAVSPAVVVASSDKAYGPSEVPYTEQTPLAPVAPYDVSKAAADLIARSYALSFGLPVVITRGGNLYGPGDLNPERLIPHVANALARGRGPVLRGTGAMSREWLYVDDAAAAALLLLDRARELAGRAFNVGGGQRATVRQIVERLTALSGLDPAAVAPRYAGAEPPGEILHQALDSSALYNLGWKPTLGLDEGLARTLEWTRRGVSG